MQKSIYRRRRLAVILPLLFGIVVVAYATGASGSRNSPEKAPPVLRLELKQKTVARIPLEPFALQTAAGQAQLSRVVRNKLPATMVDRRGRARITLALDRSSAAAEAVSLGSAGGTVNVATEPVAATIAAPVLKQKLRNICESAALEVLLATEGVRVPQLTLQQRLRRDGPLDPVGVGASRVWGDPELGYVGRPDGGGVAGGFGVYPKPIIELASKYRVKLTNMTGGSASEIYDKLLSGRAVMAWMGLGDGPFTSWVTKSGKPVNVNLNEHTVVLTGIDRTGTLRMVDPLTGTRKEMSQSEFEAMWTLLGKRSVAV
ncbi:MAG: C39 family peptidase [Solirubrobacterales bacterium]|nr:C39 family peptidase [Solirubrobacterales bacterium]